jgi:hypothetical protein
VKPRAPRYRSAANAATVIALWPIARAWDTVVRLDVVAFGAARFVVIDGAMPHLLGVERRDFHPVLLVRGFRDSHPVVRACNESHYGIHAASRVGRWRSDRSGTLTVAPVKGVAWTCSLFVDGDPGWCLGRRFSRRERQLPDAAERLRQTSQHRDVGVNGASDDRPLRRRQS